MTVKYSLDLKKKIKPCTNKVCKSCGLYLFQLPVYENAHIANVFWVGLSAVAFEKGIEPLPLSPNTNSGALISRIEESLLDSIQFYKTNLVKCVPIKSESGKIRYPLQHEMEKCFPNLEYELDVLSPKVVFLLGKQVSEFVMQKHGAKTIAFAENFRYKVYEINGVNYVPIHHPSYIIVYRRKLLNKYIKSIQMICKALA